MAEPLPFPQPPEDPAIRTAAIRVFVRSLTVEAEIGIYPHEHGRTQRLHIEVELSLEPRRIEHFADTFNYETVCTEAKRIAESGHMNLVETFADRLGRALMTDARVIRARVRVEKPEALAPQAEAAGVEVMLERG
jgi:dihydroneopterin aldolase